MMKQKQMAFPLAAITAAVLAAYAPAHAEQNPEIEKLTRPQSAISVGVGYVAEDAPRFGQYSGLNKQGGQALLNVDINKLDTSTGTWIKFRGNNLGLESRDMRLTHERQGDWAYYLDYNEMPRFEPYTINTAVTGIGTTNVTIPTTAAAVELPVHIKMKREALGLGYSKILGNGFDLQIRGRNEEKDGARIFSRGNPNPMSWEFAPEPINSTTRQLDAILGYNTEKLYLAGSYYGTWYNNHAPALNIAGGALSALAAPALPFSIIALPPGSQSHQLALTGNYSFTKTTKATFKAAYTKATQDDTFIGGVPVAAGINPNGSLNGRVDTTLLQFGLTARPMPKLSLLADARYENRNDKTPIRLYTTNGLTAANGTPNAVTFDGYNEPRDIKTLAGKLEASYRLPMEMRLTGGVDYVEKERNTSAVRVVSYREKTEEISYKLVLQRSLSESVAGSIGYIHSDRDGSPFLWNTRLNGADGSNRVAPLHLSDRQRDKLRLSLNWTPVEQVSVQFQTEQARDDYDGHRQNAQNPVNFQYGLRDGTSRNHSIDITYAFSDEWQANAWISKNDTVANRGSRNGQGTADRLWASTLINDANSFGIGLRGKPFPKLEIGADLSHSEINDVFRQWDVNPALANQIASLPDYFTRQSSFKLFGIYELEKNSSLRFDYIHDRFASNDWTWSSWVYGNGGAMDGTYLSQRPRQSVNFIGVTYIYKFY